MKSNGFTLIELSIVLVIIGLIVGGVLVGQDLIRAAQIRATISQIEKYNTAANTFRGKYNGLPGDLKNAASFGMTDTSSMPGEPTGPVLGNDLIESCEREGLNFNCEIAAFWNDLSSANLIEYSINNPAGVITNSSNVIAAFSSVNAPPTKLGNSYIMVGVINSTDTLTNMNISTNSNYWMIDLPTSVDAGGGVTFEGGGRAETGAAYNNTGPLTPTDAFSIDSKIDDGLPASGTVQAFDYSNGHVMAIFGSVNGCSPDLSIYNVANIPSTAACGLAIRAAF